MKKHLLIISILLLSAFSAAAMPAVCRAGSVGGTKLTPDISSSSDLVGPSAPSGGTTAIFENPFGTTDTLPKLIDHISDWLTGIVAGIAVIMIMVGGFQYVWNSGNANEAAKAKSYIQNSIIGLVLVLSVNMIISEINYLLGIGDGDGSFFAFATRLIDWGIVIIAGLAVLFLMYAGYTYIMVGADSKNSDKAKNMIRYALTGLVIALLSYAIVRYIVAWFGA